MFKKEAYVGTIPIEHAEMAHKIAIEMGHKFGIVPNPKDENGFPMDDHIAIYNMTDKPTKAFWDKYESEIFWQDIDVEAEIMDAFKKCKPFA